MTPVRRPARRRAGVLLAAALPLLLASPPVAALPASAAATVDPPVVVQDARGDVATPAGPREGTGITRREARSADWTRVRFDLVQRDGEPTPRTRTWVVRTLPARPGRYVQLVQTYFDEELKVKTTVGNGRAVLRAGFGGPADEGPGCDANLDHRVGRHLVVQRVPTRCLLIDSSEMTVYASARTPDPRRTVGADGHRATRPVQWR